MTRFTEDDLTCDAFLGGKLHLWQPRRGRGYRAGVDPVLLAASIEAKAGQSVLELGCGAGAAVLCLGARVPGLTLTGCELQPAYAELARRNGGAALEVVEADLTEMPLHLRQRQFDHVLANPPYFDRAASVQSRDPGRETALGEATPLRQWVRTAARRLKPKGQAHFIHRAERLPEILAALPHEMGSVEVLPLASRAGRMPELILLRARKNGRGAFRLYHSFVMHRGARHEGDGDSYVPEIEAVLRRGAPLVYPTS
ncbi:MULTISPECIES: tRNA1(Val) (adenine(37)-N6)-methyltransferase [Sulfitobacter]|uniref:tRNA1(Val) (adenine(37)-N6)-methyltransferase n=1 Tax=Sulfitobacter TaxID=60136 RepID=UPI00230806F1|nr:MULTISPECIES: methyltransferase domain-containing protein [Sulfitobacter]MDF3382268.1 methyltransferase domain-containing protein [Sulfitobacter sp. Ks11]MDF3385687.1 methyltransferase domain-containing protein [Sulfitobacter sp. M85]MDF3389106.1 methyltransferase domain-containing protein [Sulfitobacter sp. Ks16]MDF3399743.1 methyltransferase domain-containing protein [Sulfitobacter sp. KE39]MDF3403164.1 methyltransferase domain-containing protein [Sulfitobacter sp. Ks35]